VVWLLTAVLIKLLARFCGRVFQERPDTLRPFGITWFLVEDDGLLLLIVVDDDDDDEFILAVVILNYFSVAAAKKIRSAGFRCLLQIDLRAFKNTVQSLSLLSFPLTVLQVDSNTTDSKNKAQNGEEKNERRRSEDHN